MGLGPCDVFCRRKKNIRLTQAGGFDACVCVRVCVCVCAFGSVFVFVLFCWRKQKPQGTTLFFGPRV